MRWSPLCASNIAANVSVPFFQGSRISCPVACHSSIQGMLAPKRSITNAREPTIAMKQHSKYCRHGERANWGRKVRTWLGEDIAA
jgi:hypothetical protein